MEYFEISNFKSSFFNYKENCTLSFWYKLLLNNFLRNLNENVAKLKKNYLFEKKC